MTLVQLEYVVAVDTYRSFVIAAEKCFVTQPTLSMQIQKLEETLGVKLFDRSRQPVTPTEIGVRVIEHARKTLAASLEIKEIVSGHTGEIKGDLKLGVIPTIAPYLLPKVIPAFMEKYPKLQLQVWELTTDQIVAQLKTGQLDCGLLSTPLEDHNIAEMPLFYENFVAYAAEGNALLKSKTLSAADIDVNELWLLNEGHCMRNQVMNICQQKRSGHQARNFEYNTGSVETLKRMVDVNNGFTILPALSLEDFTPAQLERVRYFKSPEPAREISVVTHRSYVKRNAIEALKNQVLEVVPKKMRNNNKKAVMEIYSA
ncbi:MAG: DNA-binding transcriptional regulator OxyR [Sphingobacteriaceae bacterium]|jgi:LysR family hydrogen peroxide-inducible transcriptional activator|nr:DNA-binding transcriptional regulator OxyR [Sphingobacteriaceae bacterium]